MDIESKDTLGIVAQDLVLQAIKSFANAMVQDAVGDTRGRFVEDPYQECLNDLIYSEIKEIFNEKKPIVRDIIRQSLIKRLNESLLTGTENLDVYKATKFAQTHIKAFKGVNEKTIYKICDSIIREARYVDINNKEKYLTYSDEKYKKIKELAPQDGMLVEDVDGNTCTVNYYEKQNEFDFDAHWRVTGPNFPGGMDLGWCLVEGIIKS